MGMKLDLKHQWATVGLTPWREWRFHKDRRWRFDWYFPEERLAVEVEGGIYGKGPKCHACGRRQQLGHNSATGRKRDVEKYQAAAIMGIRVLPVTVQQVESGEALQLVCEALGVRQL